MDLPQITIPYLSDMAIPFLTNIPILLIVFISFLVVYIIFSVILIYHWTAYGMHNGTILFAETVFTAVSLVLLIMAFLALNYF